MTDAALPHTEKTMSHYYGLPLRVKVHKGKLSIEIGVETLAHAAAYSDWANPYVETAAGDKYMRSFAIVDPTEFAKDVLYAMLDEREDGSTPLSDFLDSMMEAAVNDGSIATEEASIKHGEFGEWETWSRRGRTPR